MVHDKICRIHIDFYGLAIGLISAMMSLCYIGCYVYALQDIESINNELTEKGSADNDKLTIRKKIIVLCAIGMIVNASLFVASILVIIASYKVNHRMVVPWIVLNIIGLIYFLTIMGFLVSTSMDKLKGFKSVGAIFGYSMTVVFMIFGTIIGGLLYGYLGYQRAYT